MNTECKHEFVEVRKRVTPDFENKKRGQIVNGSIQFRGEFTGKRHTFVFLQCEKCKFYRIKDLETA